MDNLDNLHAIEENKLEVALMENDKNRFVAEKLGILWHKPKEGYGDECICGSISLGYHNSQKALERHCKKSNPNFSTDSGAVELLRLMMGRPSWWEFISEAWWARCDTFEDCFKIITTPGALLDAAAEYFGWKEGE